MPASATRMRREPSNWNGLVTTATVRMPNSLATRAMTEAAPVPVPPPMPAAMNTMWAAGQLRARISSIASSAAASPISGLEPAPRPSVRLTPSWMRCSALEAASACASVLATMNLAPLQARRDHVVDGVAAGAADADHGDARFHVRIDLLVAHDSSDGIAVAGVVLHAPTPNRGFAQRTMTLATLLRNSPSATP